MQPLYPGYPLVLLFPLLIVLISSIAYSEPTQSGFHFREIDERSLGLWDGDAPVFVYRFGEMSLPGNRAAGVRSSYVHPIHGLDGEVLTDDFPADHYHHHGLFWGWPHVTIAGRHYDLWKMRGIRIDFERWLEKQASSDHARLGVENGWYVRDKKVANEQVWFDVHPTDGDSRAIDVTLKWTPIDESITLGGAAGKSYGGLSLRFAPRSKTIVTAPEGRVQEDLLITKLPWADLSGQFIAGVSVVNGVENLGSGIALFVHPDHPNFQPEWMTREYGLLAVGWPGVESRTLQPGETVICRYRLWIHRGTPDASEIQKAYERYKSSSRQN